MSDSPGIEYSPLPPIIPISACDKLPPEPFSLQIKPKIIQEQLFRPGAPHTRFHGRNGYNSVMKLMSLLVLGALCLSALGQQSTPSTTVPITLDHNRVIIDVFLPQPDGS